MKPLVSICIPTYNSGKYIRETLLSLQNQTYTNLEIIIGDNFSTDETELLVKEFIEDSDLRIVYYKNLENLGYSGNCNKLIGLAEGEFIAIYHSDDIYESDIIEKQVQLLLNDEGLAGCFTLFSMIDTNGKNIKEMPFSFLKKSFKSVTYYDYNSYIKKILNHYCNPLFCPSSMVRRKLYVEFGGYAKDIKFIEDQDMWIRLLNHYKLAVINEKKVKYRIHPKQGSSIYSNTSREKISPMISHLSDHLLKKYNEEEFIKSYKVKLERLCAIDNIRLSYYSVKKNEGVKSFSKFIMLSKSNFVFSVLDYTYLPYFFIQRLPSSLVYSVLKLMNRGKV